MGWFEDTHYCESSFESERPVTDTSAGVSGSVVCSDMRSYRGHCTDLSSMGANYSDLVRLEFVTLFGIGRAWLPYPANQDSCPSG